MQPNSQSLSNRLHGMPGKRPLSIDGVVRRRAATPMTLPPKRPLGGRAAPPAAQPRPIQPNPVLRPSASQRQLSAPVMQKRRKRTWEALQWPLVMSLAMAAGLLSQSLIFGVIAITAYGVCALILKIKSSLNFGLALIALITTIAVLIMRGESLMAQNFATYTFLLMVVGVTSLLMENRSK